MTGCRIAVYGLGRSGLAVARAALALGATPTVFDSARPERMVKQGVVAEAQALGVEMHFGWEGRFDPSEVDLLVPNPGVDSRSSVLRHARQHGIEIASEIEFAYRVLEARELAPPPQYLAPIVAITGTNGKSTTTVMTYLALRECGIDAVLCGNVFGTGYPEITMTEAALNAKAGQVLVAEVSSFQLEWVSRFRAAVAGITNIAPDHLDRYDSFEDYAATKKRIFAGQQPEDYKVVHRGIGFQPMSAAEADATIIKRQAANLPHWTAEHGTYAVRSSSADAAGFQPADPGLEGPGTHRLEADATGSRLGRLPHVLTFGPDGDFAQVNEQEIRILDRAIPTSDMKVVGAHNYSNASMAGLLAYATLVWIIRNEPRPLAMSRLMSMAQVIDARIDQTSRNAETDQTGKHKTAKTWALPEPIVSALTAFPGIEHRMEFVGEKSGVRVVNNSMCTNPEAVVNSARAVDGHLHLLMGGKDKDLPFEPVRFFLNEHPHEAYLYGEAKDVLNTQLGGAFPTYNTLQEAFRAATERARPGETIVLAPGCASTDQFDDFRDRGNVFKQIAMEWLNS